MIIGSFIKASSFDKFTLFADFSQLGFGNWTFDNYAQIFSGTYTDSLGNIIVRPSFAQYFLNTLIVAIGSTVPSL